MIVAATIQAGCITADKLFAGAITCAKIGDNCSEFMPLPAIKKAVVVCPCCGSRQFEHHACIYCNAPQIR